MPDVNLLPITSSTRSLTLTDVPRLTSEDPRSPKHHKWEDSIISLLSSTRKTDPFSPRFSSPTDNSTASVTQVEIKDYLDRPLSDEKLKVTNVTQAINCHSKLDFLSKIKTHLDATVNTVSALTIDNSTELLRIAGSLGIAIDSSEQVDIQDALIRKLQDHIYRIEADMQTISDAIVEFAETLPKWKKVSDPQVESPSTPQQQAPLSTLPPPPPISSLVSYCEDNESYEIELYPGAPSAIVADGKGGHYAHYVRYGSNPDDPPYGVYPFLDEANNSIDYYIRGYDQDGSQWVQIFLDKTGHFKAIDTVNEKQRTIWLQTEVRTFSVQPPLSGKIKFTLPFKTSHQSVSSTGSTPIGHRNSISYESNVSVEEKTSNPTPPHNNNNTTPTLVNITSNTSAITTNTVIVNNNLEEDHDDSNNSPITDIPENKQTNPLVTSSTKPIVTNHEPRHDVLTNEETKEDNKGGIRNTSTVPTNLHLHLDTFDSYYASYDINDHGRGSTYVDLDNNNLQTVSSEEPLCPENPKWDGIYNLLNIPNQIQINSTQDVTIYTKKINELRNTLTPIEEARKQFLEDTLDESTRQYLLSMAYAESVFLPNKKSDKEMIGSELTRIQNLLDSALRKIDTAIRDYNTVPSSPTNENTLQPDTTQHENNTTVILYEDPEITTTSPNNNVPSIPTLPTPTLPKSVNLGDPHINNTEENQPTPTEQEITGTEDDDGYSVSSEHSATPVPDQKKVYTLPNHSNQNNHHISNTSVLTLGLDSSFSLAPQTNVDKSKKLNTIPEYAQMSPDIAPIQLDPTHSPPEVNLNLGVNPTSEKTIPFPETINGIPWSSIFEGVFSTPDDMLKAALRPIDGNNSEKDQEDTEFAIDIVLNMALSRDEAALEWVSDHIEDIYWSNEGYVGESVLSWLEQAHGENLDKLLPLAQNFLANVERTTALRNNPSSTPEVHQELLTLNGELIEIQKQLSGMGFDYLYWDLIVIAGIAMKRNNQGLDMTDPMGTTLSDAEKLLQLALLPLADASEDEQEDIEFAIDIILNLAFSKDESAVRWVNAQLPELYRKNPDYVGELCLRLVETFDANFIKYGRNHSVLLKTAYEFLELTDFEDIEQVDDENIRKIATSLKEKEMRLSSENDELLNNDSIPWMMMLIAYENKYFQIKDLDMEERTPTIGLWYKYTAPIIEKARPEWEERLRESAFREHWGEYLQPKNDETDQYMYPQGLWFRIV